MQSVCVNRHFKPAAAVNFILGLLPVIFYWVYSDFLPIMTVAAPVTTYLKHSGLFWMNSWKGTDKSIDKMLMYSFISDILNKYTDQPFNFYHWQVKWITLIILLHWHLLVCRVYQAASEHFVLLVVVLEAGKMEGSEWVWHGPGSEHLWNFSKKWPEEGQQLTRGGWAPEAYWWAWQAKASLRCPTPQKSCCSMNCWKSGYDGHVSIRTGR